MSFRDGTPQGGIVRKWRAVPAEGQAVKLGPWVVDVPHETLTVEQRQAFLDHLFGLETAGGFLILEATLPLRLWPSGEGELVTQIYSTSTTFRSWIAVSTSRRHQTTAS